MINVQDVFGNTTTKPYLPVYDASETYIQAPTTAGLVFSLNWRELVSGSAALGYDIQVKQGSGAWTAWKTAATETEGQYFCKSPCGNAVTLQFQVRGIHADGTAGAWSQAQSVIISTRTDYYTFEGRPVAVKRGSQFSYFGVDHLGSTRLVTDATGAQVARMDYDPFGGELRAAGKALSSDKTYTHQRTEDFGLMDYNARYYDPSLNRFLSPDTIVPDHYNFQAWDRFAYALNNPVKFTDPSGHKVCEEFSNCNTRQAKRTANSYKSELSQEFGWEIGANFSYKEVKLLYKVAWDMRLFFSNRKGGRGKQWMDNNLGPVNFVKDDFLQRTVSKLNGKSTSLVFPLNTIHFANNFADGGERHVSHELNHVIDNIMVGGLSTFFGGGPADRLVGAMGGIPFGLRFLNNTMIIPPEAQIPGEAYEYAHNSSADYFAESLAFLMYPNLDGNGQQEAFPNLNVQKRLIDMIKAVK